MGLSSQLAPSAIAKPGVCTSSTRPASPYDGQVIYETDTDKTLVWNGSAWVYLSTSTANPPGLELVKSVTVGSAVTSVNITSCFSATYENYVVSISNVTASAGGNIFRARPLSGTTAVSSGIYGNTFYIANGAAGGLTNGALSNVNYSEVGSISSVSKNGTVFRVEQPFLANYTRFNFSDADENYWRFGAFVHRANTSYDGLQIDVNAGTFTGGTIAVYGYKLG